MTRGYEEWFSGYAIDPVSLLERTFEETADEVERLLAKHDSRTADHSQAIWTLLIFELWHRRFVDIAPAIPSAASVAT